MQAVYVEGFSVALRDVARYTLAVANRPLNQIRADYNRETIVVYQAYRPQIAAAALVAGRFVPPFSFGRMTWIKPSFLWLMERSNWGQKSGQECVLAVRVTRAGWEQALSRAVLTQHDPAVYHGYDDWRRQFEAAAVVFRHRLDGRNPLYPTILR